MKKSVLNQLKIGDLFRVQVNNGFWRNDVGVVINIEPRNYRSELKSCNSEFDYELITFFNITKVRFTHIQRWPAQEDWEFLEIL